MRAESSVYSAQNEECDPADCRGGAAEELLWRDGGGGQYFCFAEGGTCSQAHILAGSCRSSQGRGVSIHDFCALLDMRKGKKLGS